MSQKSQPTLLRWFTKSPATNKTTTEPDTKNQTKENVNKNVTPVKCKESPKAKEGESNNRIVPKRLLESPGPSTASEESSPELKTPSRKRPNTRNHTPAKRRRVRIEDDSEDEYKPDAIDESSDASADAVSEESPIVSESEYDEDDDDIVESKPKKAKKAAPSKGAVTPRTKNKSSLSDKTVARLSAFSAAKTDESVGVLENDGAREWPHLKFDFLQPDKIMDKQRRRPDHPEYDPTTLYIPESFIKKQTPAHAQWWEFKASHYDTVFFFKMGKFYELFHMDAVIAVSELNLLFMRGEYAHAGFPEKSYRRFSDVLLQKGYKIARVEQTETPEQRDERCKNQKKKDAVVSRELCRITTVGTRTSSFLDAEPSSPHSTYLLAISELSDAEKSLEEPKFGVCFIETSIGKFYLSQFTDDRYCSKLRTLFTCFPPAELLLERNKASPKLLQIISNCLPSVNKVMLKPKEFWDPEKTLKTLNQEYYNNDLPALLVNMTDPSDALRQKPLDEFKLCLRSLGAVIFYLKSCLIDEELLSLKLYEKYVPPCGDKNNIGAKGNMVIDSVSLKNLEIFENSAGGTEGTLFNTMDYCGSKFGKRLLRSWLCAPLCDVNLINDRLDAIDDLKKSDLQSTVQELSDLISKLPDLERLLSKIHTQGCARRSREHPDARAVLFDNAIYSKRKILDFLAALEGFKITLQIRQLLYNVRDQLKSKLLLKCASYPSEGYFPDITGILTHFDEAFDHNLAKKEGKIIPRSKVDEDYDLAVRDEKDVQDLLEQVRRDVSSKLGAKVTFANSGKTRYMLEVPDAISKKLSDDYEWKGSRKGFRRFHTAKITTLLTELAGAEERKENILKDIMRRIFESFSKYYNDWIAVVKCVALVDCLISLTKCSTNMVKWGATISRPIIEVDPEKKPFISIEQGRHPSLLKYKSNFVPNDISLGDQLLLLTGPNMGGKSTLMRQTGLIAIMAQIGCYVPASKCHLSLLDAIFTRLGAYDRITEGQSTFYVELSETSLILKNASKHSLVLLDELGRGTSTYDGTAIASAVINELIKHIQCRTLFSTHYHSLVEQFCKDDRVKLGHMACMVENENEEDPSDESITFLYQLTDGPCPKSYGFNAAKLAGIPIDIIRKAHETAKAFETFGKANRLMRSLINDEDKPINELRNIIKTLQSIQVKF
ncbi:DNA mismatch repair protein Msh6 [Tetranychus urticae]|uniref:DNA mismatch repair protein n=1 Tax=Tetranychus urticae TaxID=32264 RepID=T1KKA9_TETUR|nr:DNA mismatch repair protein Msh6 [Tetranychus urticae]